MSDQAKPANALLIYLPGLSKSDTNTGEAVADVVAATLDRTRPGDYRAIASKASAPRGLRVTKTVLGPDGKPVLDVFELDYLSRIRRVASGGGPTGIVASAVLTIGAVGKVSKAVGRGAKSKVAKAQLALACVATSALLFATIVAILALAGSAGWLGWVPKRIQGWGSSASSTGQVAAGAGGVVVVAWAAARKWLLALADDVRAAMRYLKADRHRDTVIQVLDDAVDGLLDSGWTGKIHVLGYSFGSLVAVDSLFPAGIAPEGDRVRGAVSSLTTIGWPVDAVRLFYTDYFDGRRPRIERLPWTNVFIAADVFGSNLANNDDLAEDSSAHAEQFAHATVMCVRYTQERLSYLNTFLLNGFRRHAGYWDTPDQASCFDRLVSAWVPLDVDGHLPRQHAKDKAPVTH